MLFLLDRQMLEHVARAYDQLDDVRPLVRPTYSQFEITFLPPYGDPEVHIPGELGTYIVAGLCVNAIVELIDSE